jgi:hypothetical protein
MGAAEDQLLKVKIELRDKKKTRLFYEHAPWLARHVDETMKGNFCGSATYNDVITLKVLLEEYKSQAVELSIGYLKKHKLLEAVHVMGSRPSEISLARKPGDMMLTVLQKQAKTLLHAAGKYKPKPNHRLSQTESRQEYNSMGLHHHFSTSMDRPGFTISKSDGQVLISGDYYAQCSMYQISVAEELKFDFNGSKVSLRGQAVIKEVHWSNWMWDYKYPLAIECVHNKDMAYTDGKVKRGIEIDTSAAWRGQRGKAPFSYSKAAGAAEVRFGPKTPFCPPPAVALS